MNTEERRLSEWLHNMPPTPPRQLTIEDIALPQNTAHGRTPLRRWLPILAAASVALIAGISAVVVSSNPSSPAPRTFAPQTRPPQTSATSVSPSSAAPNVPAGTLREPWHASAVGGPAAAAIPLAGTGTSLYALDRRTLFRLDAATGRVLSTRPLSSSVSYTAVAAGTLWIASNQVAGDSLKVQGLDLTTLAPSATITVPNAGAKDLVSALIADASGKRLIVGVHNTIFIVDAANQHIIQHYTVAGAPIQAMATAPDGNRLYVTSDVQSTDTVSLAILDPNTGAAVAAPVQYGGGTGFDGISASAGGVWLETGQGMTNELTFHPFSDLASTARAPATAAGGGFDVSSTVTPNVVWIGGTTELACADPQTGAVRAGSTIVGANGDASNIAGITLAGNRLYAHYAGDSGPTDLLVTLTAPTTCTRR